VCSFGSDRHIVELICVKQLCCVYLVHSAGHSKDLLCWPGHTWNISARTW